MLPKELRDRAGIRSGDKLAVVSWLKDGEVCCLTLIRARHLEDHVRDFLEPVLKGVEGGARSGKETREMKPEEVKKAVRTGYAKVALENAPCCGGAPPAVEARILQGISAGNWGMERKNWGRCRKAQTLDSVVVTPLRMLP